MATIEKENKSYTELEVWKESRILVKMVYGITKNFPPDEKFGLALQLRRAAVSIISNIAEGTARNHNKDTIQFLFISKGSLYEVETQLIVSQDLDYLSEKDLPAILEKITLIKKLLQGFINYYRQNIER